MAIRVIDRSRFIEAERQALAWPPKLAVAVIAERHVWDGGAELLMVRRNWPPYYMSFELPTGAVKPGQTIEAAAQEALLAVAGVDVPADQMQIVGAFASNDERGATMTVVYRCALSLSSEPDESRAYAVGPRLQWRPYSKIPSMAFDHAQIVARRMQKTQEKPR